MRGHTELRTGYSTGACAAAVIKAAYLSREEKEAKSEISLLFPDGTQRVLSLTFCADGFAEITKDAGDDPDCTNGAHIFARIKPFNGEVDNRDYCCCVGQSKVYVRAVEGIGLTTRRGLPCKEGKWAINPMPLEMITNNLAGTDMVSQSGHYLVELGVRDGKELAKKTLNERLGIVGGISILGTTGFVRPYSHDAYEKSIQIQVDCAKENDLNQIIFATGSRTASGAQELLPTTPPEGVILIADFIGAALKHSEHQQIKKAYVACMPGKLLKYIAGYENTHAHKKDQRLGPLGKVIKKLIPEKSRDLNGVPTVRQAVEGLSTEELRIIFAPLVTMACTQLQKFAPSVEVTLLLFDFQGKLLTRSDSNQYYGDTNG